MYEDCAHLTISLGVTKYDYRLFIGCLTVDTAQTTSTDGIKLLMP